MESPAKGYKYCWLLKSGAPNAKIHKVNSAGLPRCGRSVDLDALERSNDLLDAAGFDMCKRCSKIGESLCG